MNNRQRLIETISNARLPRRLASEIEWKLDVDRDEPYDAADALCDVLLDAEDDENRTLVTACVDVLIAAGYYQPRSPNAEVCHSGGRDRAPVRKGVKYDCEQDLSSWIDS